jgi:hypothetical protein
VTAVEEILFMIKKWIYYSSITIITAFISLGFETRQPEYSSELSTVGASSPYIYPSTEITDYTYRSLISTGKTFTGFKESLAYRESRGRYKQINTYGYMGKYQFGAAALKAVGISNHHKFLNSPSLQENAFVALLAVNKAALAKEIEEFNGKEIAGIKVTESGILAAAHLVGAGSVKRFFRSNGSVRIRDGYGTSLRSYLRDYAGYDTSHIEPDIRAVAHQQ